MSKKPLVLDANKLSEIKDADALILNGGVSANGVSIPANNLSHLSGARSNLQAQIDAKTGGGGSGGFTDFVSFKILANDSIPAQTDDYSMRAVLKLDDSIATPSEAVTLKLPQPNFIDSLQTPTESRSFKFRVWLSGSTGGTTPTNADGPNDGNLATLRTAAAGVATITMTSFSGVNLPNITANSAIYRGWFNSVNTLQSSSGRIIIRSSSSLFSEITIFLNTNNNTTVNRLDGSFTFDLIAAGINTLAKLQSIEVLHRVTDSAAGVTPHVLTVDAACLEIITQ